MVRLLVHWYKCYLAERPSAEDTGVAPIPSSVQCASKLSIGLERVAGPLARKLALYLGFLISDTMKDALKDLGVGFIASILISVFETVFDWSAYTYAPGFTVRGMIEFAATHFKVKFLDLATSS